MYPICTVIQMGLCNGPNLPSMRLDALQLHSLCQPGLLHPSRGVTSREWTKLLIFFPTHKNDAKGRTELDEDYHEYQCLCWTLLCSFFLAGNPFPACLVTWAACGCEGWILGCLVMKKGIASGAGFADICVGGKVDQPRPRLFWLAEVE